METKCDNVRMPSKTRTILCAECCDTFALLTFTVVFYRGRYSQFLFIFCFYCVVNAQFFCAFYFLQV